MSVVFRDVSLRDGLQLVSGDVAATDRIALARDMLALGIPELEIGSMARPDLVPQMAATREVVEGLSQAELERCWIWAATPGHVRRAADWGIRRIIYCLSVSDAHNEANIGRTTERSLELLPDAVEIARAAGMTVQLALATAFTCPFTGPVDPERVVGIVHDPRVDGCDEIMIADTLGQARPHEVAKLTGGVVLAAGARPVVFHGHDTWGLGVANALAAVRAGARGVDGALGGLGGCPFAPGASGNTATEDLLFALAPGWLTPDVFGQLVELGDRLTQLASSANQSRAAKGAHGGATAFPWSLTAEKAAHVE